METLFLLYIAFCGIMGIGWIAQMMIDVLTHKVYPKQDYRGYMHPYVFGFLIACPVVNILALLTWIVLVAREAHGHNSW